MISGQTEGSGSEDFPDSIAGSGGAATRFRTRGLELAILCLALSVAGLTAADGDDATPGSSDAPRPMLSAISEPVSLVLLATGLGLSARGLRRRSE